MKNWFALNLNLPTHPIQFQMQAKAELLWTSPFSYLWSNLRKIYLSTFIVDSIFVMFRRAWSSLDLFGFKSFGFKKIGSKLIKISRLRVWKKILTIICPKCIFFLAKFSIVENWIWSSFNFWVFSCWGFGNL